MKQYVLKTYANDPKGFTIDYAKELNPEQLAVVTAAEGPSLVLAGAGSGKTRTLVYRVAYLLERGVKPDRILLMTFTNKAAKEMLSRVEQLLKTKPEGLWGGTFHHVGNRILRMYGEHIGIKSDFTILDAEDSKDMIRACLADLPAAKERYFPKAGVVHRIVSLAANLRKPVEVIMAERFSYLDDAVVQSVVTATARYVERKRLANSLDYDDLLTRWNDLLTDSQEIREKLARKFEYILVDEYQDTNFIQGELIRHLAGERPNVLAVGDDSQSIYSFRGATISNILQFPKVFSGCTTYKLETNYRSTPEILNLANVSIRFNRNQFDKTLRTSKDQSVKPSVVSLYDAEAQADFVCQRILELRQEEGIELRDIAVLFRAHYQSLEIEMELNKRSIPYEMRGGLRFFEQAHIKDVVAHLKALRHVTDELAWQRVLRLQPGLGDVSSRQIWERITTFPDLTSALAADIASDLNSRSAIGWRRVSDVFRRLTTVDPNDVDELIQRVLQSGYQDHVKTSFDNAQDRIDDLNQLVAHAASYDSLDKFLTDVALAEGFKGQSIVGYEEGPEEAVTLTTVHQAKGLEWKVVFLVGLADGQFPHAKVYQHPEELEEERRLFYVAATRAKDQLYLTYPTFSSRGDVLSRPSQFLRELPSEVYEEWQVSNEQNLDREAEIQIGEDGEPKKNYLDYYL